MDASIRQMLLNNGYILVEEVGFVLIKRKIVKSFLVMVIFLVPGLFLITVGIMAIGWGDTVGFGLFLFGAGVILANVPFFSYLAAPYKSLLINLKDHSILFRSRFSRAYKFSEIVELNSYQSTRQSDTNPFSSSNQDVTYTINIVFAYNNKEELFRIAERDEANEKLILELARYFEVDVFKRKF